LKNLREAVAFNPLQVSDDIFKGLVLRWSVCPISYCLCSDPFLLLRGNGVATHYNLLADTRLSVIHFATVRGETEEIFEILEGSSGFLSASRCSNNMS
jgi:hypothetical protein